LIRSVHVHVFGYPKGEFFPPMVQKAARPQAFPAPYVRDPKRTMSSIFSPEGALLVISPDVLAQILASLSLPAVFPDFPPTSFSRNLFFLNERKNTYSSCPFAKLNFILGLLPFKPSWLAEDLISPYSLNELFPAKSTVLLTVLSIMPPPVDPSGVVPRFSPWILRRYSLSHIPFRHLSTADGLLASSLFP